MMLSSTVIQLESPQHPQIFISLTGFSSYDLLQHYEEIFCTVIQLESPQHPQIFIPLTGFSSYDLLQHYEEIFYLSGLLIQVLQHRKSILFMFLQMGFKICSSPPHI